MDGRFDPATRTEVARSLRGGGPERAARLAAFVERGGYLVTTGQQPGLFGGPLFGLYKGLTAAALARRLEGIVGRPVLPVFWIASEDHDWEEARSTRLLDAGNELRSVALPAREGLSPPLHRVVLGSEIGRAVEEFLALLPATEFTPEWAALLREAATPGSTLPAVFEKVMGALLAPAGVFLIQAHDPLIKRGGLPLLLRELRESEEREGGLAARAVEIERLGHRPQVPVLEGATNLFLETRSGRERILRDGTGYRLRASGEALRFAEIEARATADPSVLTPNVLLRPVVEASTLPTLAYVGGPAELAYLAQVEPVFRGHAIAPSLVHPRASLAVVESKVGKVLDKFALTPDDLALPADDLAARILHGAVPPEVTAALDALRAALAQGGTELGPAVRRLDTTLGGAVDSFGRQASDLVQELERKVQGGVRRRNEVALAQVEKARVNLFPHGEPQERVLNPFQYLARYGHDFLSRAAAASEEAVLPRPNAGG